VGGHDDYDEDEDGTPDDCDVDISLHDGPNLISFHALDDENTEVSSVFADIYDNVLGVIGESVVAIPSEEGLGWIGTLTDIDRADGYWVKIEEATGLDIIGTPSAILGSENYSYALSQGNNLISYPYSNSLNQSVDNTSSEGLYGVAGEGYAALALPGGGWAGSLNAFESNKGYWFISNYNFNFSYGIPVRDDGDLTRKSIRQNVVEVPSLYRYVQSMNQQFFFVNEATIDGEPLVEGDWIISYNDDVVVGARMWTGEYTDVPVMGYDGSDISSIMTAGYCGPGDVVTFKVYDVSQDKLVEMDSPEATAWIGNNSMSVISISDRILPTEISLGNAYPNPFNPSTTITYDISSDMNVNINVYDVRGRMVAELVNGMTDQGRYEVMWNADNYSTGIYFVQLVAGNTTKTQKLMLVK
jgi:hypothetical protein